MRRRRIQRKKRIIRLFLLLMTIICILSFVVSKYAVDQKGQQKTIATVSSDEDSVVILPSPTLANGEQESLLLQQAVANALVGTKGNYGIAIKHLDTHEYYFSNEQRVYKTGSLYKLWIMGTTFEQIQKGKLHESDVLTQNLAKLREKFHVATESGEPKDQKLTMTVGEALEKMITVSDNYAAWLLTEKVGLSKVSVYLQRNGFTHSKIGTADGYPVTTAFDVMLFFEKLSKGELADQSSTEKMITLLKRQRLNTKLPKYLPDNVAIAHKTGELEPFTHDAGIVYTSKGSYIIVVLSESTSRYQAEDRIADISKAAYIHFMKETLTP